MEPDTAFSNPGHARRLQTAEVINRIITRERVGEYLKALQDPAPTTGVLHTRTPILRRLLLEIGVPADQFTPRLFGTRSPAVLLNSPKKLWFSAHSDQPTYIPPLTNDLSFRITPICAHRPRGLGQPYPEFPALVLRFDLKQQRYEVISSGTIGTDNKTQQPYYTASTKPKGGFIPGSDRITYAPLFSVDRHSGFASGNMDNAAGIAASLAAIHALVELAQQRGDSLSELDVGWVFPDEEEGLPENSAYFAREARRIIHRAPLSWLPGLIITVDGHDAIGDEDPQPYLVYGAFVSGGKGPIVPPDVYTRLDGFLQQLAPYGVSSRQTEAIPASLSRSDDVGFMEVHDQMMSLGYLIRDPHHNRNMATVNLEGLAHTAKALAWIAAELELESMAP
jgi:hypothetical protein